MKRKSNSSCFGFVDYHTIMEAVIAIKEINGKPPFYLNVEFAKMGNKRKEKHEKNSLNDGLNDTSLSTFNTIPIKVKTKRKNGCKEQSDSDIHVTSTPSSDVSRVPSLSSHTSPIVSEQSSFLLQSKNHLSKLSVATTKSEVMEDYEKTFQMSKHFPLALPLQKNDKESPSIKKLKKTKAKDMKWNCLSPGECEKLNVCCIKSPDEIWVQRVQELETLCKIEDAMKTLSKENVLEDPSVNDICASLYIDDMLYRAKINKVFPNNTSEVHYIDYGNTATTTVSDLFFLNEALSTYPAQAILCKLGYIKPPNNAREWNILDSKALQLLTDVSIFEANVINFTPHKYEVDLIMEDGTSVAELLVKEHNAEWISEEIYHSICVKSISNELLNSNSTTQHIPSVLHFLKNKSKIELLPVVIQDKSFWAWVYDEYLLRSFKHVESIIKKKSIEVKDRKRRSVTKGEYAAALSPSCNKWYRCYILQAKCNKFSVRYVDYGNEEIVFQVCTLEPDHLVCSPLLYCVANKPFSSEMRKVLEEASSNMLVQGVLKCFSEEVVQVDIMNNSKIICQLKGFPWYHGLTSDKYSSSAVDKAFSKQTRETSVVVNELLKSTSPHYSSQVNMKDSIEEMELSTTFRTEVKVVWWNSSKELYVQKISDEQDRNAKIEKINLHCNAQISRKYVPIEGEIVLAKCSIDNQWHRSCVLKILPVNKCHVFFIDYGNEEEVLFECLQHLPKEFAFPRLCACVSLHDIPERKITAEHIITVLDHDVWSLEVVDTLSYPMSVELFASNSSLFNILFGAKLGPAEIVPFYNAKISTSAQKVSETAVPKKSLLKSKINSFNQAIIIIVHNSSNNFYVQRVEDRGDLHSMMQAINEECNNCSKTCIPAVDDIVCVKYKEDQIWYRGCVLEILEGRKCKILFLDYGNTDEVTFDDVQPLNQRFISIPIFSICVNLDVPMKCFTKEVCNMLLDHLWKIEIVDKFSSPIKVKLYDKSNSCINNHLCDKYFSLERKANAPTLDDSKVLVSYVDKHNQNEKNMLSNLTKITLSLNHPTQVTLVWKENEKSVFVQRTSDKHDNEVLLKKLEQYCSKEGHSSYAPVKGEIVCAKCFSDKTWYRGCVLEVLSENRYSVLFIDYGNTALMSNDDIRHLPQELISYPIFCICVQLAENENASKLHIDQIYHLEVVDVISGQYTVRFLNSDIHQCF